MPIVDDIRAKRTSPDDSLESWVMDKVDSWEENYSSNYRSKHNEYYRLFRGIWAQEDATRGTERSRIVSPAIQQAVESNVAEIEEAAFGRGNFFTITDDRNDPDQADVLQLRTMMHEDFGKLGTKQQIAEIILNAAIFGTGIGEVVLDTITESVPTEEITPDGQNRIIGVTEVERVVTKLIPIMPKHFRIDSAATNLEDALGCAIDRDVPTHTIEILQESGVYLDTPIQTDITSDERMPDIEIRTAAKGQTRLTKYFGLVPRHLLEDAKMPPNSEIVELLDEDDEGSFYIEAIVIIADGGQLLKAEQNPNMMGDRNVVAFQWDKLPGMFWGRGVVEKGYNSQKALDAEMRARIDALGLTVHPMMGVDASRMPRGAKPTVAPGKMILTNGNPSEVLMPFKFGEVSQITFPQAQSLMTMVQNATGAIDISPGNINADQGAAAMSMSKGSVLKRHKRTQLNFEEAFLVPFICKVAWRYMQYEPEKFPARDYKFIVKGNLGIVAREYEVAQLGQILQTVGDDSPLKPALIEAIVDHMNVSNKEEIIALMKEANKPNPEQEKAAEELRQAQMAFQASQTAALNGQAAESQARAEKYNAEMRAVPVKLETEQLKVAAMMDNEDDKNFDRRMQILDRQLKERSLEVKEEKVVAKKPQQPQQAPVEPALPSFRPFK
jgi:uncharacterized coiled-coil protein SlyX